MSHAVHSRVVFGIEAYPVTVECRISAGLPRTTIVGLPEGAVRESRDRVASALASAGFRYPDGKVIINLAPGNISKAASLLDLPIALSVLVASKQLPAQHIDNFEWIGELGLDGALRATQGTLICGLATQRAGKIMIAPRQAEAELAKLSHLVPDIRCISTLQDAAEILTTERVPPPPTPVPTESDVTAGTTYTDIIGQATAKKALALAAAGGHHMLMVGPPGSGKTMLAQALAELMPELSPQQQLEVATIYSSNNLPPPASRPFREPHHSASSAALLGGGRLPQPGDAALAHFGVLFLDELPHFKPSVLNNLREPLETGRITISRVGYRMTYPCQFQLIAAMNPCPAGMNCREQTCRCSAQEVRRYQGRISGPLLDRIDLQVAVQEVPQEKLVAGNSEKTDLKALRLRIRRAMNAQIARQGTLNARLGAREIQTEIRHTSVSPSLLSAIEKQQYSARGVHKLWKVARTLADLDDTARIEDQHLLQALSFRMLNWNEGLGLQASL